MTTDLWILVLGVGFFAVSALYVVFCDRIIGPDEGALLEATSSDEAGEDEQAVAVGR
ncbi:MAG: hypothetical protein ACRDWD_14090 [Acidimicrobiia bacterium]